MINRLDGSLLMVVLMSSAVYSLQGQDIDALEDDLTRMYGYENYSSKIDKARLLLHIDPFNEIAIRYISYYYAENGIDSISLVFDQMISTHPNQTEPYLVRAKLLFLEHSSKERDNYNTIKVNYLHKALRIDSTNSEVLYQLAATYYKDFIYPTERENPWFFQIDTAIFKLETKVEAKQSTFTDAGRQALHYFYQMWEVDTTRRDIIYFPIKQLECIVEEREDAFVDLFSIDDKANCYFPVWYFANLSEDWACDNTINYLFAVEMSSGGVTWISEQLLDLKEPCIYNQTYRNEQSVYRFTWLRSFDHPIVVRVEKNQDGIFIFGKVGNGAGGYEPKGIKRSKKRRISTRKWDQLVAEFEQLEFQQLPNEEYVPMTDGASWTIEHKTKSGFKAHKTNSPDSKFKDVCLLLVDMAGIRVKKKNIY